MEKIKIGRVVEIEGLNIIIEIITISHAGKPLNSPPIHSAITIPPLASHPFV